MGLLSGLVGAGTALVGSLVGGSDGRDARRLQESYINGGRALYGDARDVIREQGDLALSDAEAAELILAGIEPAVLEGLDEQLRIRVAQRVLQNEQEAERTNARLAAAGLDATTVAPQVQRTQARAQGDSIGSLAASFAGQRAGAVANARAAHAQGLYQTAGLRTNLAAQEANLFAQEAGMLAGVQVQPANTGAAIGQIGSMIFNAANMWEGGGGGAAAASGGSGARAGFRGPGIGFMGF